MSSSFGNRLRVSIFGQSHGEGIGVVIDGLPAGERVDLEQLQAFLARRAPGQNAHSTKRRETDCPRILSGMLDGKTCGSPLCAVIENTDTRPADYERMALVPRPGHADYTAYLRYGGHSDQRGGGHFSGRLTAPLCVAGGICKQLLERRGIQVGAHIASIGPLEDTPYDPVRTDAETLVRTEQQTFPVLDMQAGERMQAHIAAAHAEGDSLGGVIECVVLGMPGGIGDPMFDGVENRLAQVLFGIPAVKGVEFGAGFAAARMRGSEHNDPFFLQDGRVVTESNRHGGILGGITSGMPILMRVAIKPTPSISRSQQSVNLNRMREEQLEIKGRHDPCIVPRAVPCVEAAAAAVMLDLIL